MTGVVNLSKFDDRFRAAEARIFWCVASELRHAVADPATPQHEIDALVDEITSHHEYTDSQRIRDRCAELLAMVPAPRPLLTVVE